MNTQEVGLGGRYTLKAVRPDGTERIVADWFENLVLNAGLNRIGSGSIFGTAVVGSGTTAPDNAQTSLATLVGSTTTQQGSDVEGTDLANNFCYVRRTYRFAAGVAAGNLTEVGIGWGATTLFSRALIKDGSGNPTTVTILADEVLDLVYELRVYWPTADSTAVVNLGGTNYTVTVRASQVGDWAAGTLMFNYLLANGITNGIQDVLAYNSTNLGAITEGVTGSFIGRPGSTTFDGSYVNNSNERAYKFVVGLSDITVPINAFNILTPLGMYKMGFSALIPKSNANILTVNFKLTWARRTI